MNKKLFSVIFLAVILLGVFFLWPRSPIGQMTLQRITFHGEPDYTAFIRIPFLRDSSEYRFVNAAVDLNQDGKYDQNRTCVFCMDTHPEWLAVNVPVTVLGDEASRYTVYLPNFSDDAKENFKAIVVLSKEPMSEWNPHIKDSTRRALTIPKITTAEMGGILSPDRTGQMETGFMGTALADHGEEHAEEPAPPTDSVAPASGETPPKTEEDTVGETATTTFTIDAKLNWNADTFMLKDNIWTYEDKYSGLEIDTTENNEYVDAPTITLDEPTDTTPPPPTAETPPTPSVPATPSLDHRIEGMTDINQKYNECAPTAIANSFLWLAKTYGLSDRLPDNSSTLIDELKGYTMWDLGVAPGNSLAGKNAFIQERELPLEAHMIGEENDPDIMTKIHAELQKGQAVEVSLQFFKVKNGELVPDGAHLATVAGMSDYRRSGGNLWLELHDPATTEDDGKAGRDSYRMNGNTVINYWSGGITRIRYALAESPLRNEDGSLVSPDSVSNLERDENGLVGAGQSVTRGVGQFGFFYIDMDGVGDHYVGDTFPTVLTVRSTGREDDLRWKNETFHLKMNGPWNLSGLFTATPNISANVVRDRPPRTQVNGDSFRVEQNFTCTQAGPAHITYDAILTWERTGTGITTVPPEIMKEYGNELASADTITVESPTFRCIAPESEEEESYISEGPKFSCNGIEEDPNGKAVEVLKYQGKCYPKFQFHGGGNAHDACGAEHWHSATGGPVVSLDGTRASDPNPGTCGFGKIAEVEVGVLLLNEDQVAPFLGEGVFGE